MSEQITIEAEAIFNVTNDLKRAEQLLHRAHSLLCVLELTNFDESKTVSGEVVDEAVWQDAIGAARELLSVGMNKALNAKKYLPEIEEEVKS